MLNKYSLKNILLLIISFSMSYLMAQEKIVLFNVNVIDGLNSTVQKDMMVFISNGKIESIKKIGSKPKRYKEIDLNGMYILPGFIDAHTHMLRSIIRLLLYNLVLAKSPVRRLFETEAFHLLIP